MEVRCNKCGTVFEALVDEEPLCPICRRFSSGTGTGGGAPVLETPVSAEAQETNRCAVHPGNEAVEVCSRCGNFMCHLCVIRVGRKKVCAACFNLLYNQDKAFVRQATFGERLGALFIDILVFFVIYIIVMIFAAVLVQESGGELYVAVTFLLILGMWSFYMVGMWAFAGATLGKKAVGIKIVGPDRKPPSLLRSLARYAMYWVSAFAFFIGFLWAAWEPRNRTWHDLVAGTDVIKARRKAA